MTIFERIGNWFVDLFRTKPKRVPGLHVTPSAMEPRVRQAMAEVERKTLLKYDMQWDIRVKFKVRKTTAWSNTERRQIAVLDDGNVGVASADSGYVGICIAVDENYSVPQWAIEHEMAHAIAATCGIGMSHRAEWRKLFVGW